MKLTSLLTHILSEAKPKKPRQKDTNRGRIQGPIRPEVREGVENSIKNRWLLFIDYQGDEEQKPFKRWVEPYLLGIRRETGNLTLRCFIYRGASVSRDKGKNPFPDWRTVRLDRISNLAPLTSATFNKARPKYNPNDKHMSKILLRVNFGGDSGNTGGNDNDNPNGPVDINSPEIQKTAGIIRKNMSGDNVDFDKLDKEPEFKEPKMKKALNVIRRLLQRGGRGVVKGLQNLHIK